MAPLSLLLPALPPLPPMCPPPPTAPRQWETRSSPAFSSGTTVGPSEGLAELLCNSARRERFLHFCDQVFYFELGPVPSQLCPLDRRQRNEGWITKAVVRMICVCTDEAMRLDRRGWERLAVYGMGFKAGSLAQLSHTAVVLYSCQEKRAAGVGLLSNKPYGRKCCT